MDGQRAGNRTQPTLHGGPVRLRPVKSRPHQLCSDNVAKNGDNVAETGDIVTGDIVAFFGDIVAGVDGTLGRQLVLRMPSFVVPWVHYVTMRYIVVKKYPSFRSSE